MVAGQFVIACRSSPGHHGRGAAGAGGVPAADAGARRSHAQMLWVLLKEARLPMLAGDGGLCGVISEVGAS